MDRSLVTAIFTAADARFDPCGAAAFAERLGREIDAGRIVIPPPLVVGGCLVLDRFPADLAGLAGAARLLARGLAGIGGPAFDIRLCGEPSAGARDIVARAVERELTRFPPRWDRGPWWPGPHLPENHRSWTHGTR